jgi:hypothetical protein
LPYQSRWIDILCRLPAEYSTHPDNGKNVLFHTKKQKSIPVVDLFFQLLCFFMDGTSRHLTWFDSLKDEKSYAPLIGCEPDHLASSHAVKRFFGAFAFRGFKVDRTSDAMHN